MTSRLLDNMKCLQYHEISKKVCVGHQNQLINVSFWGTEKQHLLFLVPPDDLLNSMLESLTNQLKFGA